MFVNLCQEGSNQDLANYLESKILLDYRGWKEEMDSALKSLLVNSTAR